MDMRHEQFGFADEFAVFLPFDGAHCDLSAFVHVKAVGLAGIHFGVGRTIAVEGTLANLSVDASGNEEGDSDVVVFQLQGFVETEQSVFGRTIGRAQRKAKQSR